MTTVGLVRPALVPGLSRLRRGPHTLQFGLDPQRAAVVELFDERAFELLPLLEDGALSEREVISRAVSRGIRPSAARALLASLHAHGLLVPAHTLAPVGSRCAEVPQLRAEVAALALRQAGRGPRPPVPLPRPQTARARSGQGGRAVAAHHAVLRRPGAGNEPSAAPPMTPTEPAGAGRGPAVHGAVSRAEGTVGTKAGRRRPGSVGSGGVPAFAGRPAASVGLVTPAQVMRRRALARVAVAGRGRLAAPIAITLARAGVGQVRPDLPGTVSSAEVGFGLEAAAIGRPRAAAVAEAIAASAPGTRTNAAKPQLVVQVGADRPVSLATAALRRKGQAVLVVEIRDGTPVVGPFVPPGGMPCLECLERHRADRDPDWPQFAAELATAPPTEVCDLVTAMAATAYAVGEALAYIDGGTPETAGAAAEVSAPGVFRRRDWPSHPRCSCVSAKV